MSTSHATTNRLTPEQLQVQEMISEGGPAPRQDTAAGRAKERWSERRASHRSATPGAGMLRQSLNKISQKLGRRYLERLAERGQLTHSLGRVPKRMQRVAKQTQLVLELIDDFRSGAYRKVPWHTVAIASAGILYAVSPADVVPDFIPFLGALDDMAVAAIATRLIKKDLVQYCRYKGYAEADYF